MPRLEAVSWVLTVCSALRLSQAKTLADLTAAALHVGRCTLAALGRRLLGPTVTKHRIKRAWRFCANSRVHVCTAMRGVLRQLCHRRNKRPLLIALDWTEIRTFHMLMASVVLKGRSLPLLWESYPEWRIRKSQNALEEGMLLLLRDSIPREVPVVLLADRGFGRTELVRTCQHWGLHFLIRIKSDVYIRHSSYRGLLHDYPVKKGMRRLLRGVDYRKQDPVTLNLVVRWKPGLPTRRDEPWFLVTDLEGAPARLTDLYGRRMTIEELFRDGKNRRNGWALRNTQLTKAERVDRLMLVLALAYWLLVGVGLLARREYRPGQWCSSNDEQQCSAFTIGRIMIAVLEVSAAAAVAAAIDATLEGLPKVGTT
jgi:hypothetical protein